MNENIKKQHTVSLTERSLLTVTAVSEVLGFDEGLVTLDVGDTLLAVALQGPAEDLPHHLRRLRVHQEMALVVRVLPVAVDGKAADVLPLPPLHVKDHADVLRQVL